MTPEGKSALLDAVAGGLGFIGVHCATDTFHTQRKPPDGSSGAATREVTIDPYLAMLGGEFYAHGAQQTARVQITDTAFPGMAALAAEDKGASIERFGEWYSLRDFAPDLHVLGVLDPARMHGPEYARGPYPVIWARRHGAGQGRVFYTALGHLPEEWSDAPFLGMMRGAIEWAVGDVKADTTPNLDRFAPRHAELPSLPKP
jgi:type 1 glutamine amidotransferase